jgi:hypothetical protein
MPANIAHMVIVHKAFELLRTRGSDELRAFAQMIDDPARRQENDYWKYMNLGSIGPDLYYYVSMAQSGWDMLMEGFVKAAGVMPWSYHLHSSVPNEFPLNLCRILFSDVVRTKDGIEMDADDRRKLAYIAGSDYVTHYDQAVQLSAIYITALYEVYLTLAAGKDFTQAKIERFLNIVRGADLSCPLEQKILQTAYKELMKKGGANATKYKALIQAV